MLVDAGLMAAFGGKRLDHDEPKAALPKCLRQTWRTQLKLGLRRRGRNHRQRWKNGSEGEPKGKEATRDHFGDFAMMTVNKAIIATQISPPRPSWKMTDVGLR